MKQLFTLALLVCGTASFAQTTAVAQTFRQYMETTNLDGTRNPYFMEASTKQETEGSPLLVPSWTIGKVYLTNNTVLDEPEASLNYDKMSNGLVYKLDAQKVLEVSMTNINSFTLESTMPITFKRLAAYPGQFFIEMIGDSNHYSLYKSVSTKFFPSDYVNKGLYESGYKYDRYIDEVKYYIVGKNGKATEVPGVDRKNQKKLYSVYPQAKKYFDNADSDTAPDQLMSGLVKVLNKG